MEEGWRGRYEARERERPDVNRGLDRERDSSTICVLKVSKMRKELGMKGWDDQGTKYNSFHDFLDIKVWVTCQD